MHEWDEIADSIAVELLRCDLPETFSAALAIVRREMPEESWQVQQNTAESLLRRAKYK